MKMKLFDRYSNCTPGKQNP